MFVSKTNTCGRYVHPLTELVVMCSVSASKLTIGVGFAPKTLVKNNQTARMATETGRFKLRFSSRLTAYLSAIIRMRYAEKKTVRTVLDWLKEQNCKIAPRSYHRYMLRVMRSMRLQQASNLGVDVELLRAIRVRYKLAVDPKRVRGAGAKLPAHHVRAHRRRIFPRSEPKPISTPKEAPKRTIPPAVATLTPTLRTAMASTLSQNEPPKMQGTAENPLGHGDWRIINESAREKVFALDKMVHLNLKGRVIHGRTRREFTKDELESEFALTPNEAESCFMTFSEDQRRI